VERRSLGARVVADVLGTAGFERLMLIDAHTASIEGFFNVPMDHLTAVPVLADAVRRAVDERSVVVAPDLGAVKRAREYARRLHLPMAFVHKTRTSGETVATLGVIGDVRDRVPIIVDDMLSTGGTVEAATRALLAAGAAGPMTVVVTHALLVGRARGLLRQLPIGRLVAGNTIAVDDTLDGRLELTSVAPLVATAIRRHHSDESLADLRAQT
jgi:ribose-phosphate pyrophosphokinase